MNNPFITEYPAGLPAANNNTNNNARTFVNHNNVNAASVQATSVPTRRRKQFRFNTTVRSRAFNAANAPAATRFQRPQFGRLANGKNTRGRAPLIPAGNTRRNNAWSAASDQMMQYAKLSPYNRPGRYATMNNARAAGVAHARSMGSSTEPTVPAAAAAPVAAAAAVAENENNNNNAAATCSGFGCFTRWFKGGRRLRSKLSTRRGNKNRKNK